VAAAEGIPGTLNHVRLGAGPPLVLVHGLGSWWRVWTPQLGALAAERDVVALDLPGFGRTPALPDGEAPTTERLSRSVAELIEELGLERPHVAGFSLGGGIALELGRMGVARSVTALCPIGFWSKREHAYERKLFQVSVGAARRDPERALWLTKYAVTRTLAGLHLSGRPWRIPASEARAGTENLIACPGFWPTLDAHLDYHFHDPEEIRVPVTVAWGDRDFTLLSRQRFRAQRALPEARHVTLRRCGHVPHWDDPEAVTRVLLEGSASS
jgi:pimeloyl-ACP methyl ester carboxylesterase